MSAPQTPAGVQPVFPHGPAVEGPDARAEESSPPRRPANYQILAIDGLGLALARAFRESA